MNEARDMLVEGMERLGDQLLWTFSDLTETQRYFSGGTSPGIVYIAWHHMRGQDNIIHTLMQGRPPLWDVKNYWQRLGMTKDGKAATQTFGESMAVLVEPWVDFLEYAKEVFDSTLDYLKKTPDEELATVVQGGHFGNLSKYRIIRRNPMEHGFGHLGEIFALRALQGLKPCPS